MSPFLSPGLESSSKAAAADRKWIRKRSRSRVRINGDGVATASARPSAGRSEQGVDRPTAVDLMGTVEVVTPGGYGRDPQGIVDRGGHVFGRLGVAGGIGADLVGRTDDRPSPDAPPGEEDALRRPPVVAAGGRVRRGRPRELGRAAEL